jgi:Ca2+/Na+ antiporter
MDSAFDQGDRYLDILSLPRESGAIQKGFFYMAFPLRYAIFLTTPDVRRPGSESRAIWSMCVTIVWLAILSYVLTAALTLIGNWWHISSAVMGITVAAWASNFPAHWSSMVVSRHGFGDVSCCNCLGSNTFNNLIGLGLPWLLYSIVYRGQPYDALQDDGVAISVFCMMITIVVHYVVVWQSNWVLREWMIAPMVLAYVAEIAFLAYFYSVLA